MSDDLNDEGLDDESGFDDFDQQNTLGDLWRNNPMVKVGIIFAAGAAIFGTILIFGGKEQAPSPSYVPTGSEIKSTPGTQEVSPSYKEAIEEFNQTAVEEAYAGGGSALPVPIETPKGSLVAPADEQEQEDPLKRWRRLQEERLQREIQQQERANLNTQDGAANTASVFDTGWSEADRQAIQALADLQSQQMQSILEAQSETRISSMQISDPDLLKKLKEEREEEAEKEKLKQQELGEDNDEFEEDIVEEIIIPAGTIEYGQLLIEANTDAEGPVLAQIASGPLRGSRLLGTFEEDNELITLNFDTIVIDGVSHDVTAVALDPNTTLSGMATDVDHHYFTRIVLPMAAAFVEGAAGAIADSGRTTITVDGGAAVESTAETDTKEEIASGIDEAGQELSDILDEELDDIEVTVVIAAGTPIGILFVEAVTEEDKDL